MYFGKGELKVQDYVDVDFGDEVPLVTFSLLVLYIVASWMSQIQKIVALTTIEAG